MKFTIFKELMAEESELSKAKVALSIKTIVNAIQETVKKDEKVTLPSFGTFERVFKKGRSGVNPLTGEPMEIPDKNTPKFKAAKNFKDFLDGNK